MRTYIYTFLAALLMLSACKAPKLDRSKAPAAGPAPSIQIGQYTMFTLDNGLKVIVVENHKLPRVSYSLSLDIDPILEGQKAGYTAMAGDVMGKGTTTKTKAQIDEATDFIGASLSTSAQSMFGSCITKHSETLLSLMSDVLLNPSFPEEEIEKVRKQTLSGLQSQKTDPAAASSLVGNVVKYGADHPYGETGTEATVKVITPSDLVAYYTTYWKPNVAYLTIVGDITPDQAKAQVQKAFGNWKRGNVSDVVYKVPSAPKANKVVFTPMPGAVQSVINITYAIDLKPGTQEAILANVLNNVLGGSGFQTRLMQNLREDKAYTYGAYSSISPDELVGEFSAEANVRNEVTDSAIVQFLYEMRRLVDEPVADSTLQTVKNIMTGSFARSLESPQTIARFAFNIEKYGLPKDFYQTYLQKLNAITSADVQNLAKRIVKPDNCYITVVGNKDVIPSLKRFSADGKVDLYNPDGSVYSEMKPIPAGVTVSTVINKYIQALGGADNIRKIKSFETTGKMSMGPMALDMVTRMKDNQRLSVNVKMGQMEIMKQVFDGKKGVMIQMGQKTPMEEGDIADALAQTDMLYEMNYEKYGVKAELKGIDVQNGEEVYVMEVKKPDGMMITEYYSVNTGLKTRTVAVENTEDGTMTQETNYKEYKEVNGVKFAALINQVAGQQSFDISVDDIKVNPTLNDADFVVE
jgi:zinc protease